MTKAILFNGVALSGKDTAIAHLLKLGIPLIRREAKDRLHELTQQLFNISSEKYWIIYNDRNLKEAPLEDFRVSPLIIAKLSKLLGKSLKLSNGCLSIRQAMIYTSEEVAKPLFGNNYFGVTRANSVQDGEIIVDGSTGFLEELPPLIDRVGMENILLIRVHRGGYTFEGDSRGMIPDGIIDNTIDINNVGTLEEFLNEVSGVVFNWLGKQE